MNGFDGQGFTGTLLLVILIFLFIFGSTDIGDLTDAPGV